MKKIFVEIGILLLCFVGFTKVNAASVDVVFLGVLGKNALAIEKTFDIRMRSSLSLSAEYRITDYNASQDLKHKIDFGDYPILSRRLVESLRQFSSDSTIFAWITIKSQNFKPVRTLIINSEAVCELVLTLNVYSLRYKEYAFIGDVRVQKSKSKGLIFFYPVDKGVHITSLDRDELLSDCIDSAAYKTSDLLVSLIQNEKSRSLVGIDTTGDVNGLSRYKAPSISDMFNLPSVEAAKVGANRKKPAEATESKPVTPTTDQKKTKP